jgi:hypothetical protein
MAKQDQVYVANQSGGAEIKGDFYPFVKGVTRVREGHPLLKSVPEYFDPVENAVHYDLEKATAGPGEKRGG